MVRKWSYSGILVRALLVCVCMLCASCDPTPTYVYHVGLSQCSDDAWRTKMNEEMRRELLFYPEIELRIRSANDNSEQQSADIDAFIEEKVDLLIVSPNEADGLTDAVSRAYDAGIPVIVADRRVHGDKYTAFIGGDNEQVGRLLAQYIRQELPNGGRIVEMLGLEGSTPMVWRHKGLMEQLQGTEIEVVSGHGDWFRENAYRAMASILDTLQSIDMVVAQNDQMALGAWDAAHALIPDNRIRFIGVDALSGEGNGLEAILQDKLEASVSYVTAGDLIIETAAHILSGEPYIRDTVLSAMLISKQAAEPLQQLYKQEQGELQTIAMLQKHIVLATVQRRQQSVIILLMIVLVVVVLLLVIYYRRLYSQRKRLSEELMEAQRHLEDMTMQKLSFFTNVSHDFRTPLTLIIDPLHQLSHDGSLPAAAHNLASMAERNAFVLLRLINQVLDLRKAETGKLELQVQAIDLSKAMQEWVHAFSPLARKKHIGLTYVSEPESIIAHVDVAKMERVLFNLLANAFKFTPENGKIDVRLERAGSACTIKVTDTGAGVPEEHKKYIFDSFYQVDTANRSGSGIGLALVKSFVMLHGGTVQVGDNPQGRGTVFTVMIPLQEGHDGEDLLTNYTPAITSEQIMTELHVNSDMQTDIEAEAEVKGDILLVVDDNADIRSYVRSLFEDSYTVLTAKNGSSGLQKACQVIPDIVICDLSMPDMDGLEVCRRLKNDVNTSHIPVLMLTARAQDEQKMEGYRYGADAYVAKPFSAELLRAQVEALIQNRRLLQETYRQTHHLPVQGVAKGAAAVDDRAQQELRTPDEKFLDTFNRIVYANISDDTLSVETLAKEVGMSRTQLYRKVKQLTNYSPVELVRNIRMEQAKAMLLRSDKTVSEVAYAMGFSSPSYFTKCYTEYFGERPSDCKRVFEPTKN